MTTINAKAIADSFIAGEIDMRRGHAARSYFKRQARRQVRHRLEAILRNEVSSFIVGENRRRMIQSWFDNEWKLGAAIAEGQAVAGAPVSKHVPGQPSNQPTAREVQVIRKVTHSPYERKQIEMRVLVA